MVSEFYKVSHDIDIVFPLPICQSNESSNASYLKLWEQILSDGGLCTRHGCLSSVPCGRLWSALGPSEVLTSVTDTCRSESLLLLLVPPLAPSAGHWSQSSPFCPPSVTWLLSCWSVWLCLHVGPNWIIPESVFGVSYTYVRALSMCPSRLSFLSRAMIYWHELASGCSLAAFHMV